MPTATETRPHLPHQAKTPASVLAAIIGVSAVAALFLSWLVYYHQPTDVAGTQLAFLPALNATLNGLCTVFLLVGFSYIRKRNIVAHRNSMFGAFIVSSLFLVSYIVNHALHGDMRFLGEGHGLRTAYFALLISHIGLSVVALPMILITFFLSLTGRFPAHRALARWTFPIWLYVSVTGVIVYAMLAAYR
jgi:putative membrane protein